jgi:hypothetical protein
MIRKSKFLFHNIISRKKVYKLVSKKKNLNSFNTKGYQLKVCFGFNILKENITIN